MATPITDGLTLNTREKKYLQRLNAHNWYYPLASVNSQYKKGKENELKLKQIADTEGGNFLILFTRVEQAKRGIVV